MAAMTHGQPADGAEAHPWEDDSAAVLRTVGKVIKMWREKSGRTQAELGSAIGYGEEQVSSVERGRRAPRAQFLEAADQVLGAGGMIAGSADAALG
ncbi:helix-turn-helix protein [Streptomyces jeddahensis]|uniref:Helix-turn-helix protein n=1 Tax=Streptomyces jeddahensis TaxID=1716141 RepID=A0A177HGM0_9ACTN|nr:helix-turn-helix protein [Streptomyces jeddahensis]